MSDASPPPTRMLPVHGLRYVKRQNSRRDSVSTLEKLWINLYKLIPIILKSLTEACFLANLVYGDIAKFGVV